MDQAEVKEISHTEGESDRYHIPGKTTIAPEVLLTIVRLTTLSVQGVSRMYDVRGGVNKLFRRGVGDGVRIEIGENDKVYADLYVVVIEGVNIRETAHEIQIQVTRAISELVGLPVGRVDVHVEDIDFLEELEA